MRVGLSGKEHVGTLYVMERLYIFIGFGLHEYAFIRTHPVIHLRFIHFTISRFYFSPTPQRTMNSEH